MAATPTPDEALDAHLRTALAELSDAELSADLPAAADDAEIAWWWDLFTAQLESRELDLAARRLQRQGRGQN